MSHRSGEKFWGEHCNNPILHGLFQAGSTRGDGGGGHKVSMAFFSETVKATTIKLGTVTN